MVWADPLAIGTARLFDGEGLYCADNGWNVDPEAVPSYLYGPMWGRHAALRDKTDDRYWQYSLPSLTQPCLQPTRRRS